MADIAVTLSVTLHARPAALLIAAAGKYEAKLQVGRDGRFVDVKSLLGLLSLGAQAGTILTIRAEGPNAAEAAEGLARFVRESIHE